MGMTFLRYKGKEPCQGCGRTGEEVPRREKNTLCEECSEYLRLGKQNEKIVGAIHYMGIRVQWYKFHRNDLNSILFKFLDNVNNPDAPQAGGWLQTKSTGVTACEFYNVPKVLAEPMVTMLDELDEFGRKLYDYEKKLKEENERTLNKERNRIFNDGVEHGRNLLFQLNRGEITAEDINREIKKY